MSNTNKPIINIDSKTVPEVKFDKDLAEKRERLKRDQRETRERLERDQREMERAREEIQSIYTTCLQTNKQTNKQTDGRTLLVPKVAIATEMFIHYKKCPCMKNTMNALQRIRKQ